MVKSLRDMTDNDNFKTLKLFTLGIWWQDCYVHVGCMTTYVCKISLWNLKQLQKTAKIKVIIIVAVGIENHGVS